MNKFKVVNHRGINYYNRGASKTVNMTYDDVNESNSCDVYDFNCFTVRNSISNVKELACEVMSYVANNMLEDDILKDVSDVSNDEVARKIVNTISRGKTEKANYVFANYDSMDLEDNTLSIYAENGDTIDFNIDEIVNAMSYNK